MKCMVIVKATKDSENGIMPSAELLAAMDRYNEELIKAGIMQGGGGLRPTSHGKRVRFSGTGRTVVCSILEWCRSVAIGAAARSVAQVSSCVASR